MPLYSFRINQGDQLHSGIASEHPNDDAAKGEASGMFADMARGISECLQSTPDWQIEVADHTGKPIFRIKITAQSPN
jgi:hypothetical protein